MPTFVLKSYAVTGGLDQKYDEEEYPKELAGYISRNDWNDMVRDLNARMYKHRFKKKDVACLMMGVLMLPLVPVIIRFCANALVVEEKCEFLKKNLPTLVVFFVRYNKHQSRLKKLHLVFCREWNERTKTPVQLEYDRQNGILLVAVPDHVIPASTVVESGAVQQKGQKEEKVEDAEVMPEQPSDDPWAALINR